MKIVLSPNPYRDKGLKTAQAASRILKNAGVDIAVAGSSVFKSSDPKKTIEALHV